MNTLKHPARSACFLSMLLVMLACVALPARAQSEEDPCAGLPERVAARREAFRRDVEAAVDALADAVMNAVVANDASPETCTEELVRQAGHAMYETDEAIERYPRRMLGNWFRNPCILNDVRNYERIVGNLMHTLEEVCGEELDVAEIICPHQPIDLSHLWEATFERLHNLGQEPLSPACPGTR